MTTEWNNENLLHTEEQRGPWPGCADGMAEEMKEEWMGEWMEGWMKGWMKGWEDGWIKGWKEGREEAQRLIAKRIRDLGVSVEIISQATELSIEQIAAL